MPDVRNLALQPGAVTYDVGDRLVDDFLRAVRAEVIRARAKWPADGNPTMVALVEEVGEVAKASLEEDPSHLYLEAVQLACMAARIAIDGDDTLTPYRAKLGLQPL